MYKTNLQLRKYMFKIYIFQKFDFLDVSSVNGVHGFSKVATFKQF